MDSLNNDNRFPGIYGNKKSLLFLKDVSAFTNYVKGDGL